LECGKLLSVCENICPFSTVGANCAWLLPGFLILCALWNLGEKVPRAPHRAAYFDSLSGIIFTNVPEWALTQVKFFFHFLVSRLAICLKSPLRGMNVFSPCEANQQNSGRQCISWQLEG